MNCVTYITDYISAMSWWLVLLAEENEALVENHLLFDVIHILGCSILMTVPIKASTQRTVHRAKIYRPAPVDDYIYCYLDRCRIRGRST
jgi:hypothetical protein